MFPLDFFTRIMAQQVLDGLQVNASGIQRRGAEVAKPVRGQLAVPGRKPPLDRAGEPGPQRLGPDTRAAASVAVAAFAGQQRCRRIGPVVGELVAHIDHPPLQQLVDVVDARDQPRLRPAAAASLAETHMRLAELAQIGPPVADVEHRRLGDPQPDPAPQRRRQIVACRRQVLARRRQRVGPRAEERVHVVLRRRDAADARIAARGPVELVDRLLDHHAGERGDVALVAGDQELEEVGDGVRLRPHGGVSESALLALVCEIPVRVGRRRGPHRASQEGDEAEQRRTLRRDLTVGDSRPDHRQRVLVDELLLELLQFLDGGQPARGVERPNDSEAHRPTTSANRWNQHDLRKLLGISDELSDRQPSGEQAAEQDVLMNQPNRSARNSAL